MGVQASGGGPGFAGFVVVVLVLGFIITYIWWIVGAAALVGAFFAARAIWRVVERRRLEAEERDAALARRADRQHRWALRGDARGVFGPDAVDGPGHASIPLIDVGEVAPGRELPPLAAVARSGSELSALRRDKRPGWRWALFASVLVQRRKSVENRLRDSALGFVPYPKIRLHSGVDVAGFVAERVTELCALCEQVDTFMLAPAFTDVFGEHGDESTADADGIEHIASRLMDYCERFIALSELTRSASVPSEYTPLMRDLALLADAPLQGYQQFIDEVVATIDRIPDLLRYGQGTIQADPCVLEIDVDDQLMRRISRRVQRISA